MDGKENKNPSRELISNALTPKPRKTKRIAIRATDELHDKLEKLANSYDITISSLVSAFIELLLEKYLGNNAKLNNSILYELLEKEEGENIYSLCEDFLKFLKDLNDMTSKFRRLLLAENSEKYAVERFDNIPYIIKAKMTTIEDKMTKIENHEDGI